MGCTLTHDGDVISQYQWHIFVYYTVSQIKRSTFKLSVTLSNLYRFSKFLHYWKVYKIRYKTDTTLPTSP